MTAEYVRDRITSLRIQKGVSEYKMSYDLGHSRGYINNISSGKSLPSLTELFAICDYFDITIVNFFNEKMESPQLIQEIVLCLEKLSQDDLQLVVKLIERISQK